MASLPYFGKIEPRYIEAKDFEITRGEWRPPTPKDPSAKFISGEWFILKFSMDVDPLADYHIKIGFEVRKTKKSFGWEKAVIRMHAQLGEDTEGKWETVKDQFDALEPNKKGTIYATFNLRSESHKKLWFTFRVHVEQQDVGQRVGGLKFFGASIADANPAAK